MDQLNAYRMFVKLDEQIEHLLCCAWCKSDLVRSGDGFACNSCGLTYPAQPVATDVRTQESVFDFRILRPSYCVPDGLRSWTRYQTEFEHFHAGSVQSDSLDGYLGEIDSVREIYTDEYHLAGSVLDVGGHQGRLRHFLGRDVSLYVSVDPFSDVFAGIGDQAGLLRAYPVLSNPCNFVVASAEHLPFRSETFDWIHMRSVVDHLSDPYLAFLEAFRCAKPGGRLLVGLLIPEKAGRAQDRSVARPLRFGAQAGSLAARFAERLRRDGAVSVSKAVVRRLRRALPGPTGADGREDDHIFRFTHGQLLDLFRTTGWDIEKEHWQKPPFDTCLYACGKKRASPERA